MADEQKEEVAPAEGGAEQVEEKKAEPTLEEKMKMLEFENAEQKKQIE